MIALLLAVASVPYRHNGDAEVAASSHVGEAFLGASGESCAAVLGCGRRRNCDQVPSPFKVAFGSAGEADVDVVELSERGSNRIALRSSRRSEPTRSPPVESPIEDKNCCASFAPGWAAQP